MIDVEAFFNKHKDNKLWNKRTVPSYGRGIIFFYDKRYENPLMHDAVLSFNIAEHKNQNEKYWLNHIKVQLTLFGFDLPRDLITSMPHSLTNKD